MMRLTGVAATKIAIVTMTGEAVWSQIKVVGLPTRSPLNAVVARMIVIVGKVKVNRISSNYAILLDRQVQLIPKMAEDVAVEDTMIHRNRIIA
jgi:hypothetical protein